MSHRAAHPNLAGIAGLQPHAPNDRPRHDWIDVAKGIAISLVVIMHSTSWLRYAGVEATPFLAELNSVAKDVRMPLFFTMAGLFAGKWIHTEWRSLINQKLALLIWVFLLWQPVMVLYKYAAAMVLPDQPDGGLLAQLLRMVASPVRPNAELWFLWALVLFFVVAKLIRNWPTWLALLATGLVSVAWSGVVRAFLGPEAERFLGPGLSAIPMYLFFFQFAARCRHSIISVVARISWPVAAAGILLWIVVIPVLHLLDSFRTMVAGVFLSQLLGMGLGILLAVLLSGSRIMRAIGQQTLPIYLSHTTIVVFISSAFHVMGLGLGHPAAQTMIPWLVACIAVALGLLLNRFAGETFLLRHPVWFRVPSRWRTAGLLNYRLTKGLPHR